MAGVGTVDVELRVQVRDEGLLNQAAVRRLVKACGRVETSEHLAGLDARVREILVGHCNRTTLGRRLHSDLFIGVPPTPRRRG